jgi:putative ABC transport system ATP-binding protein
LADVVVATDLVKVHGSGVAPVRAVDGVSLSVSRGEFVCIMGPSGSGKSTLLHMLGGLESPTRGSVRIDGTEIHSLSEDERARFRRRNVGFVFQFFSLVPTLTTAENVALPLLLEGHRYSELRESVESILVEVGLGGRALRAPSELSGGEMQRVAIARALLRKPRVLLADEPTGNLDTKTGQEVLSLLRRVCDESQSATVIVTHDLRVAGHADRVLILRDGRVEQDSPTDRTRPDM